MRSGEKVLEEIFHVRKPIMGMVHLKPLPVAPRYQGEAFEDILEAAVKDAEALKAGGVDGLIVENQSDIPYLRGGRIGPEAIACMAVATREVRKATGLPTGVSFLANGAKEGVAAALAGGGLFVRVAMWAYAYIADEGLVEAAAPETLRYINYLRADHVKIFADVQVEYGSHFIVSDKTLEDLVIDTELFGADAIVVTGPRTGVETPYERVVRAKKVSKTAVIVGTGVNPENVERLLSVADGAIVGSYFKEGGVWWNPVVEERVKKLMKLVEKLR